MIDYKWCLPHGRIKVDGDCICVNAPNLNKSCNNSVLVTNSGTAYRVWHVSKISLPEDEDQRMAVGNDYE